MYTGIACVWSDQFKKCCVCFLSLIITIKIVQTSTQRLKTNETKHITAKPHRMKETTNERKNGYKIHLK